MSLEQQSEKWLREYSKRYPWVSHIIKKYGLDLPLYDLGIETSSAVVPIVNRAHLIEDVHFLKTFDEYVSENLPPNFSSVLEVGVGLWNYVFALAAFFRKYNSQVPIVGIDDDPNKLETAKDFIQNRNVNGVEIDLGDITHIPPLSRNYDVVVNLCPNLASTGYVHNINGFQPTIDSFFSSIWNILSENGLFVMGLCHQSGKGIRAILAPFFKDIVVNQNPYYTNKSVYPLHCLITAKPKLQQELPQS